MLLENTFLNILIYYISILDVTQYFDTLREVMYSTDKLRELMCHEYERIIFFYNFSKSVLFLQIHPYNSRIL